MYGGIVDEGFVLRKTVLLESDLTVTVFSKTRGKVRLFAKGIRTLISTRAPSLQTGCLMQFKFRQSHGVLYLTHSHPISLFSVIRKNEKKVSQYYLVLYLLDQFLAEQQPEERIYEFLRRYCTDLSHHIFSDSELLERASRLMGYFGYETEAQSKIELIDAIESILNKKIPRSII